MKPSYLIQRLRKPIYFTKDGKKVDNPFSFGGGLKNGGLSKEAMDIIREIFSFDYMGASEFEWGAVPEAMAFIRDNKKDYITYELKVKYKKESSNLASKGIVYVITHKDWKDEIGKRIKDLAFRKERGSQYVKTKEWVGLDTSLRYENYEVKGWLELNNGYFFFIDKEMFEKTCALFRIK